MTDGPLVERLRGIVGTEHVVTHKRQLATYESDGLLQYAVTPAAVVLPGTAAEVAAVVRACHEAEVPWVARGAGSGLSGGALPVEEGILIALSRLRRILEVDIPNGRVLVEPGVTNIAVSQAVAPTHFFPPDPSSQIVCTIGGNVAENSGGAHCFKYGFTTNYVTGLELVLPDGSEVTLGGPELDHPGYDLLGAFVGSEGTLGIATKIWLRVVPKPEAVRTLVAFFGSTVEAGEVVSRIVSEGIVPGAIEMMDNLSIRAAEGATGAGYPVDAGAALVVELDGSEAECETRFEHVIEMCDGRGQRAGGAGRGRARADLAHPQGGLRRDGPHRPQLLRAGQRDPAHVPDRGARQDRRAREGARSPGGQCLPRRATGTCTRSSVTTARSPARRSAPRSWRG